MKKLMLFVLGICSLMTWASADNSHGRISSQGFALHSKEGKFEPYAFTRHTVGENDVLIEILYAGICHSDIHAARDEQRKQGLAAVYPMVPGHEMAGRVVQVGKNVTKFKVGDYAGVGSMVNSCGHCSSCDIHKEQFCENGTTFTYNSPDKYHGGEPTMGGYSNNIVVSERFAVSIPHYADLKRVAPLLCAGVTTWSPIHFSKVKKGDKVGVAGFGGLGHMAVQYLVDLGADVTVFDISEEKRSDALRLGARSFVNASSQDGFKGLNNRFDFIITTIPSNYDPLTYVRLLKYGKGEMAIVGLPDDSNINIANLALGVPNRKVYASLIGGIQETQEMLDYSVKHNIYPEVEIIRAEAEEIDKAYSNVVEGKVRFRYVIDMQTMK